MIVRFNTNIYGLLAAFSLSVMAVLCAHARAASLPTQTSGAPTSGTDAAFRVAPEKSYFAYRPDIPLVEQFLKQWDARRHS